MEISYEYRGDTYFLYIYSLKQRPPCYIFQNDFIHFWLGYFENIQNQNFLEISQLKIILFQAIYKNMIRRNY